MYLCEVITKVRRKYLGKPSRKGVSDLVVILTLMAISIPVVMAVQSWLGAQTSRVNSLVTTPELQGVLIGKSSEGDFSIFILKITNNGDSSYNLSSANVGVQAILRNGSTIPAQFTPVKSELLKPTGSVTAVVKVGTPLNNVKTLVLEFTANNGEAYTLNINID